MNSEDYSIPSIVQVTFTLTSPHYAPTVSHQRSWSINGDAQKGGARCPPEASLRRRKMGNAARRLLDQPIVRFSASPTLCNPRTRVTFLRLSRLQVDVTCRVYYISSIHRQRKKSLDSSGARQAQKPIVQSFHNCNSAAAGR